MNRFSSSKKFFSLAFGILLLTNIIVLAGVAYNRSGEPYTKIKLTERELISPYVNKDNSGLALRMNWRVLSDDIKDKHIRYVRPFLYSGIESKPEWLDDNKLMELGFHPDIVSRESDYYKHRKVTVPKEVYIVLEHDGTAYQEAITRAQQSVAKEQEALKAKPEDETIQKRLNNAKRWLEFEHIEASRLFAVDAGLNQDELRKQYSDNRKYVIAKGLVTTRYTASSKDKSVVIGKITRINIYSIHVPLQFRKLFHAITPHPYIRGEDPPRPPRYTVDLAYGKRLEPWIEEVQIIE